MYTTTIQMMFSLFGFFGRVLWLFGFFGRVLWLFGFFGMVLWLFGFFEGYFGSLFFGFSHFFKGNMTLNIVCKLL